MGAKSDRKTQSLCFVSFEAYESLGEYVYRDPCPYDSNIPGNSYHDECVNTNKPDSSRQLRIEQQLMGSLTVTDDR